MKKMERVPWVQPASLPAVLTHSEYKIESSFFFALYNVLFFEGSLHMVSYICCQSSLGADGAARLLVIFTLKQPL